MLDHGTEREGGDDQPDCVQHALHPAGGEELVERRLARLCLVAGGERGPDPLQQRQVRLGTRF